MKKKSTLITLLFCLVGINVFAHRTTYFNDVFTDSTNDWVVTGGDGSLSDGFWIITPDGSGQLQLTKSFPEALNLDNFEKFVVSFAFGGSDNAKIKLALTSADGVVCEFSEEALVNDEEVTQNIVFDSNKILSEQLPSSIKSISVIITGATEESLLGISEVYGQSIWVYPVIGATQTTTRVEAEDYDEGAFGETYYSHITTAKNRYRKSDPFLNVEHANDLEDSNGFAIADMGEGPWDKYDEETYGPYSLENGVKMWAQWLKYTIEVENDCMVDISLRTGTHWGSYQIIANPSFIAHPYVYHYTGAWVLSIDGENVRGSQTSRPVYDGKGDESLLAC